MTAEVRFWLASGGGLSVIVALFRIVYVLGKVVEAAAKHVKDSDKAHADYESRLRVVEGRRR